MTVRGGTPGEVEAMKENAGVILVAVCAAAFVARTIYEFFKHYGTITPNRISFAVIAVDMVVLWLSWFAMGEAGSKVSLPAPLHCLGGALTIAGGAAFIAALGTIRSLETYEGDLMTKGIYSKIRHPMYLGFILWLAGNALFTGSAYSLALALPFIALVLVWRRLEEIELVKRFTGYGEYKKSTWF